MDVILLLVLFVIAAFAQMIVVIFFIWMLRARQIWGLFKIAVKGYGTLIFKSHFDRSITLDYNSKPVNSVMWKIKDKVSGKVRRVQIPLKKVYHTLQGTAINVHFCPVTAESNIDLNAKEQSVIDKEMQGALLAGEYMQARLDAEARQKIAGFDIEKIQLILLVLLIIIMCVNAWFTYNVLGIVGSIGSAVPPA